MFNFLAFLFSTFWASLWFVFSIPYAYFEWTNSKWWPNWCCNFSFYSFIHSFFRIKNCLICCVQFSLLLNIMLFTSQCSMLNRLYWWWWCTVCSIHIILCSIHYPHHEHVLALLCYFRLSNILDRQIHSFDYCVCQFEILFLLFIFTSSSFYFFHLLSSDFFLVLLYPFYIFFLF